MRNLVIFGTATLFILVLIALGVVTLRPTYVIRAGEITFEPGLSGTFVLEKAGWVVTKNFPYLHFVNGMRTNGTGGACLVVDPAHLGPAHVVVAAKICTLNSQCGPGGYCHTQRGKCWVRPGPGNPGAPASAPYCNRSVDHLGASWQPGTYPANRISLTSRPAGSRATVSWRVVACLNEYVSQGVDSGDCGTPDGKRRMEVMGPIKPVDMLGHLTVTDATK